MIKLLIPLLVISNFSFASDYLLNSDESCYGHKKVPVSTPGGTCVGMVVDKDAGLKKPRKIIEVSKDNFIITDMVNWNRGNGIVWKLETGDGEPKLTKLFTGLNLPHGLRIGPDGLIYVGETNQIFRFNYKNPKETYEVVIDEIPSEGKHPISEFIFTKDNRLILNIGAPSDQCLKDNGKAIYPCKQADNEAVLREYSVSESGEFTLMGNLAYGLRNSMGIVELENGNIIQFNNGMDFKEEDGPMEEVNLITPGAHYGWPFCYERGKLNKKFKRTFFNRRVPKINCGDYTNPIGLLPAHSAPLDALLYKGEMFEELNGKVLVSLHGYRKNGQRIIAMDIDDNKSSNDLFEEIVYGWTAVSGVRPKGAPVGLTIGSQGEVYFVDDKNKTIMVIAKGAKASDVVVDTVDVSQVDLKLEDFKEIQKNIINKHCIQCHGNFSGDSDKVAKELVESGLVKAGKPELSEFFLRLTGESSSMAMPPGNNEVVTKEDKTLIKNWIESLGQ